MAASSPALSNNTSHTHTILAATLHRETPQKTLRGLNKPKCIQCSNVACSRVNYSFKVVVFPCCVSFRNSLRVASLRQLSNNFAQFNNVQMPLCSRKPLTRKDATVMNEWRFCKLKEYRDRNIEVENEASDRCMQNISLLEEVFL
ncbi:uncharacterized protein LOC123204182 isoform X1 [Mangifera indica]|uniref:uncharacterized protein LOC123204182 isoform X1 n=1 Tax=Mangifera indica TaxID=29780 RepID=UPI001CFB566D|nr:uncharacterized protein LOC123204182 isoform X1 [Mangifera indica]